jgi:hypothetical protein
MKKRIEKLIYITENKFGMEAYRKPIVWFDKILVAGGILAAAIGKVLAGMWVIHVAVTASGRMEWAGLLVAGLLLWVSGEYFMRTGNRGLIYHHMDLLADYLDRRSEGSARQAAASGTRDHAR